MDKPMLPVVLGTGPLAEAMRAQIAADPDRYRPETWSMKAAGTCPCCNKKVYRCKTRHTGFESGFSTHDNVVHPSFNAQTFEADPQGSMVGCCCVAPNWGPKHSDAKAEAKSERIRRKWKKEAPNG